MGISPVWQRERETQELVIGLIRKVHAEQERIGEESFYLDLAFVVIVYLREGKMCLSRQGGVFFQDVILPRVEQFARTELEKNALFAVFLQKVIASVVIPLKMALQKQLF